MHDILEVIKNIETIYSTNSSLSTLKDFERVLDEMNMYVYENWQDGELAAGPKVERHWVTASFMWPRDKMPDPSAAKRLLEYGCTVKYQKTHLLQPRHIKTQEDLRPGTKKGKIDSHPIWVVEIDMPKKLMQDVSVGREFKEQNKMAELMRYSETQAEPAAAPAAQEAPPQ